MAKIKIQDDSGDRDFFTIVPNYILNHSSSTDQSLYLQMKRYAGEDGKCFATQETLMNKLGVGIKAYKKSLEYLIKKGWIDFVGLTGGKTRPIKTYKINNIWEQNSDHYKKISAERTLSSRQEIPAESNRDTSQKNSKIPAESTVEEEPVLRRTIKEEPLIAGTSPASVILVIDSFEDTNPSYRKWYGNTTQRGAIQRMIDTHGLERLLKAIKILPSIKGKQYFPTITTPVQLEDKWASLESAFMRIKNKEQNYVI